MGNLTDIINADIKKAMLAKESVKLEALRAVKSALLLLKTEKGSNEEITPEQEIAILRKLVKQREDSAKTYRENNRTELAVAEEAQLEIISEYLPQPIDDAKLNEIIQQVVKDTNASSMKDMGKVMGKVRELTQGRADNKTISEKVKSILNT